MRTGNGRANPAAAENGAAVSSSAPPNPSSPRVEPGVNGSVLDEEMLRLIAELYYVRDQSQSTIAELTGFSISKVSRLLSQAREAGIVHITVQAAPAQLEDEARQLATLLGLSAAHVTPGRSDDPLRATRLCAMAAAPWVAAAIPEAGVLGLAGGYTLAAMVESFPNRRCPHLTIVPLVGGWDPATPHLDINELSRRAAERLDCSYQLLHAPGRLDSTTVRDALLADSAIRVTTEYWDRLSMALLGISGAPHTVPGYTTVMDRLSTDERDRLAAHGVVGDMFGHLFDIDGRLVDDPTADRTIAAPIEALRRTPHVVAVAAGRHKIEGIIGACRSGLVHTLVTDQPTAEGIRRRLGVADAAPGVSVEAATVTETS
jgi:DNA-binding transcriptional regulator LsrR (DeoR family)